MNRALTRLWTLINFLIGLYLIRLAIMSAPQMLEDLSKTTDFAGIAGLIFGIIGMPLAAIATFSAGIYPNKLWVKIINSIAALGATVTAVTLFFADSSLFIPIILLFVFIINTIKPVSRSNQTVASSDQHRVS